MKARQLTPEHEALVERIIKAGQYDDPDEVIGEALRQMDEQSRRLMALRAALAIGSEQLDRGEGVEWTPALRADIMRRAKSAAKTGRQSKPDVCP